MNTVNSISSTTKFHEAINIFSFAKTYFSIYPDSLKAKSKLLDLVAEQEEIFGKEKGKIGSIKEKQRNKIYETINTNNNQKQENTETNKLNNRYVYNLEKFINMIEQRIPLLPQQKAKLAAAFLITQDGFSQKTRKTGGPAFSHILGVVKLVLEQEHCDFQMVLEAVLHDNIEDLKDFNLDEYRYLFDKRFHNTNGKNTLDLILELSHKPWYHRLGFLPIAQRKLLHEKILAFASRPDAHKKTKKFSIQIGHNTPNNSYEGLDDVWNVMDPDDADLLRKALKNDPETQEIMHFVMGISDFRFFDKRLSGKNLAIKFADRLQNTQKLFEDPVKSILSLFETQYHFLAKDIEDKRNVQERMQAFPLKRDPKISHYDVLAQEVEHQKHIAKQQCSKKLGGKEAGTFDFDARYTQGYALYIKKTKILERVDENRKKRIDPANKYTPEKMHQLEQEIDALYKAYGVAEQEFSAWMNIPSISLKH